MGLIQTPVIKRNLQLLCDKYNEAMLDNSLHDGSTMAALYSKLAIIELGGWVEQTVDRLLQYYLDRTVLDTSINELVRKEVIDVVYSANYKSVKDLIQRIVGAARYKIIENGMHYRGKRQPMIDLLNEINKERNPAAHTYYDRGVAMTFNSPLVTQSKFNQILPILKSIERSLVNFTR